MRAHVCTPSVEPPPLPPRPSDLLPPNRLPRIVTNDEGEVFWYIPKKQTTPPAGGGPTVPNGTNASDGAVAAGANFPKAPTPVPKPNFSVGADRVPQPHGIQADDPVPDMSPRPAPGPSVTLPLSPQTRSASRPRHFTEGGDASGFDAADTGLLAAIDTPAPCLVAPTPMPGRHHMPPSQVASGPVREPAAELR